MVRFYLAIGNTVQLRESVATWREGDALIERLRALGERLCATPRLSAGNMPDAAALREVDRLDTELIEAGNRFSLSLGHVSRVTAQLLTAAIPLVAVLLLGGSAWYEKARASTPKNSPACSSRSSGSRKPLRRTVPGSAWSSSSCSPRLWAAGSRSRARKAHGRGSPSGRGAYEVSLRAMRVFTLHTI